MARRAYVTELTGLLRIGHGCDQFARRPATMRVSASRERPPPGVQPTLFEADGGWRYSAWVTNLPERTTSWCGQLAYMSDHSCYRRFD